MIVQLYSEGVQAVVSGANVKLARVQTTHISLGNGLGTLEDLNGARMGYGYCLLHVLLATGLLRKSPLSAFIFHLKITLALM